MGTSLVGSTKWVGGVISTDNKIYGIPFDATQILIIQDDNTASLNIPLKRAISAHYNKF
jgi:hypothetical protein